VVSIRAGIYVGTLSHRRFTPARHDFTYPIFMVSLDIDRIAEMLSISPLTSFNRWNAASFYSEDHFGNPLLPLRERLAAQAAERQASLPQGKIFLLTHLRYFGYTFNPVSFFYCHAPDGRLETVVAEVNKNFGETHNYWLQNHGEEDVLHADFAKEFHVSPFLRMEQRYQWTFGRSGDSLIVQTNSFETSGRIFDATLKLEFREWNRRNLHSVLLRYPWMTLKVITAIHWQAVRLWWKKVPVAHHPGAGKFARAPVRHFGASWSPGAPMHSTVQAAPVLKEVETK
jgi:DUF1365 family protein